MAHTFLTVKSLKSKRVVEKVGMLLNGQSFEVGKEWGKFTLPIFKGIQFEFTLCTYISHSEYLQ